MPCDGASRPLLEHQIEQCRAAGFTRMYLETLSAMADEVTEADLTTATPCDGTRLANDTKAPTRSSNPA